MKKIVCLILAVVMSLAMAFTAFAAEGVLDANVDPFNTEVTDEQVTICFSSEPAYIWGGGSGVISNDCHDHCSGLFITVLEFQCS